MKVMQLLALASVVGCSSSPPAQTIYADWFYQSGTSALGLDLRSDGTYTLSNLTITSANTAEDQSETGTFVDTGSALNFTPAQFSCANVADPPYSGAYTLSQGNLVLHVSTQIVSFEVNTAAPTQSADITTGCYTTSGFVAEPLANVN